MLPDAFSQNRLTVGTAKQVWIDSVYQSLSPRERIAQIFVVSAYPKTPIPDSAIVSLIKDDNIGGLIYFQGGPKSQVLQTNYYQSIAKTKLLISIDGEWGVSMRLDSVERFPYQMSLGAIQNDSLIYEMGRAIARQCKDLGIHLNYAPVVDVNNNSKNPVINYRSFGEDMHNVASKGIAYMKGMQDEGVIANAKHFPGHGDTDQDSHETLPMLPHSRFRIDSLELFPFRALFNAGVKSVMVGHLEIPQLDTTKSLASSLSKNVVTDLLIDSLKYAGAIFTDGLAMNGVSSYYKPGTLEVKAILAGNDFMLCSTNPGAAIDSIEMAIIRDSLITWEDIDKRCRKMLALKFDVGLNNFKVIDTTNLLKRINSPENINVIRTLAENYTTLLQNRNNILPLKDLGNKRIAVVSVGDIGEEMFTETAKYYAPVKVFKFNEKQIKDTLGSLIDTLQNFDLVLLSVHCGSQKPSRNYGLTPNMIRVCDSICLKYNTIVSYFGNAYGIASLKNIKMAQALIVAYQNQSIAHQTVCSAIFGGSTIKGRLPVSCTSDYKVGQGLDLDKIIRLQYVVPAIVGVSKPYLDKVDSIVMMGIDKKAYPGCQVLFAKDGKVFYNKSFGTHTYDSLSPKVLNTDIYDVASITKIASTTLAVMKLDYEKKLDISAKLSHYIKLPPHCNKSDLIIKNILSHYARLQPFIQFWKNTIVNDSLSPSIYSTEISPEYPYRVAENIYIRKDYSDSLWKRIFDSELLIKKEYKYSDLGFYLMKRVAEEVSQKTLNEYVDSVFYKPMGMTVMGYLPRSKFPLTDIIPTEKDNYFRKQIVHGDVHDQGAAMMGGVSGHAGLFSNANDLAKIMQMLLNGGEYGGKVYFSKELVQKYTSRHFEKNHNRRGLGFDKPEIPYGGPVCDSASAQSFGHTGFTGCMVWADPANNMIFVFLSNRIYPDADNKKLSELNIRTSIQQIMYDAINESKKKKSVSGF